MTDYILNSPILISVLGGLSYQLLPIIENTSKKKEEKINILSRDYILGAVVYLFLSAISGLIYFGKLKEFNPILVFQTGLTSVVLIRTLLEVKK